MTEPSTSTRLQPLYDVLRRRAEMARLRDRFHVVPFWRRLIFPLLFMLFAVRCFCVWTAESNQQFIRPGSYHVVGVPDGFHLLLQPVGQAKVHRVRILGAGPMTLRSDLSQAATRFTSVMCLSRMVDVRLDRRRVAPDGTLLAHIFAGEKLVSAELVRHGLAQNTMKRSDSGAIARRLRQAAESAKSSFNTTSPVVFAD